MLRLKLPGSLRRIVVSLLCLTAFLFFASGTERAGEARPGGGQSYRSSSPSRSSSSSSSRSYSSPSRSYSSGSSSSSSSSSSRSYSGSSSSYGGSGYGSSGSSSTVYVPSSSGVSAGTVIVLLVIAVIILWLIFRKKSSGPERAQIAVNQQLANAGLQALRKQDPEFDPQAFLARTKQVVAKVNETWLAGNMGPARRVISDGVYVRFRTQLGMLKADGLRNYMVDWRVVSADLLSAEADEMWDTVHVKIVGEARDMDVPANLSDAEAAKKARGAELSQYHEVWSFIRRRGKHSKKGVPALEGKCPSCGADLPLSEVVRCEYCKALVNSGEHDWVLAEITQPEEWRPSATQRSIAGLEELRQRDAGLSRQELEDRASVIFWKWVEAKNLGKPDKLARFCVEPPQRAAAELDLGKAQLRQVAVGSSELKSTHSAEGRDYAALEIRWSAAEGKGEIEPHTHLLTLARSADVKSKRGMNSLDCPECAGALAESDATTCSYCAAVLTGGKHEWALLRIEPTIPDHDGEEDGDDGDDDDND